MMRDTRDVIIREGQRVAFNWSGQVRYGEVTRVLARTIRVRHLEPPMYPGESVMRNSLSMLVLDDLRNEP